jgi:cytochrome c553
MIRGLAFAAGTLLFCAAQALAQGAKPETGHKADPAKAEPIVKQVCAACHAADGNSIAPANPKLAGQFPEYLHKQLVDFKSKGGQKPARVSPVMNGMAANLSQADIDNLAAYFSSQKLKPAAASDKEMVALGQKLWRGGNATAGVPACAGCHGPAGAGIPIQFPRLAGQYAEYVAAQLKSFREGTRSNDPNGMMRGVAAHLTDREIRAVAEYAAGLR